MSNEIVNFKLFGLVHWQIIIFTVALPIILAFIVRRYRHGRYRRAVAYGLGGLIVAAEVFHFCWAVKHMPSLADLLARSLPLHLCGWSMFLTVFYLFSYPRRRQLCFDLAYYWTLVGGFLTIIGPDLPADYPSVGFWQFFATHCLVVAGNIFAIFGLGYWPSKKSLLRAFIYTNGVMFVLIPINLLLDANYFYIFAPPETDLPLFFWPWPWYIVFMEFFAMGLFVIAYLPFWISRKVKNRYNTSSIK